MILRHYRPHNLLALMVLPLVALLAACGDSDLEKLQLEEIENAQSQLDEAPQSGEALPGIDDVDSLLVDATLIFSDEFDNGLFDPTVWNTSMPWGPAQRVNEELQYYVDTLNSPDFGFDPFVVDADNLVIRADATPENLLDAASQQTYLSGVLTTKSNFSFTYGYVELRAKLPSGKGVWPGFWMLGENYELRKPQLFIAEARGDNTDLVYHRYNFNDDNNVFQYSDLLKTSVGDFTQDFHTYGVNWEPGQLTFYVDGVRKHTLSTPGVSDQDMYLILSLAIGGWFPGDPDESTQLPAQLVIDYVRVYTLPDS